MATIFLSYSRGDDEPFVVRLHADLTLAGFDAWIDSKDLRSRGQTFHQEIKDAVRGCDRLVYVGGPAAAANLYVREEWQTAMLLDKMIIPILCKGDFKTAIPGSLALLHCDDFRDPATYSEQLGKLIRNLKCPAPRLGKLYGNLPELPANFQPRAGILRQIKDALLVDLQQPVVVTGPASRIGVQGMPGIGKTVVAAALARDPEMRRSFPDGVVWLKFGKVAHYATAERLKQMQRDVARYFNVREKFETIEQGKTILRRQLLDKAALFVFDNVWSAAPVADFVEFGPRCRALVTTRDAGVVGTLQGKLFPVDLFSKTEALELLAATTNVEPAELPQEAHKVARECGYLPLALALSAGMAAKRGGRWSGVLRRLKNADIDKIADRQAIDPDHRSIWRAMHASVRELAPSRRRRFAELAIFGQSGPTPSAAVETFWSHTGRLDDADADDLLVELRDRSLVHLDQSSLTLEGPHVVPSNWDVSLHDLLYDYASRVYGDAGSTHQTLLAAYRRRGVADWVDGPNDGYYFQHLTRHLLLAKDYDDLIALARNERFLVAQAAAAPELPLLPLETIARALEAAQGRDDPAAMAELMIVHGFRRWRELERHSPLEALVAGRPNPARALTRALSMVELCQESTRPVWLVAIAWALACADRHDEAKTALERLAALPRAAVPNWGPLVELFLQKIEPPRGFDLPSLARQLGASSDCRLAIIDKLTAAKRFDEAISALDTIDDDDDRHWAAVRISCGLAHQGRIEEAHDVVNKMDDECSKAFALSWIAAFGKINGLTRTHLAEAAVRFAESPPDPYDRTFTLLNVLPNGKRFSEALKGRLWSAIEAAVIKIDGDRRNEAMAHLAELEARFGRFDRAEEAVKQILPVDGRFLPLCKLGETLAAAGKCADQAFAEAAMIAKLREKPDDGELMKLIRARARAGRHEDAEADLVHIRSPLVQATAAAELARVRFNQKLPFEQWIKDAEELLVRIVEDCRGEEADEWSRLRNRVDRGRIDSTIYQIVEIEVLLGRVSAARELMGLFEDPEYEAAGWHWIAERLLVDGHNPDEAIALALAATAKIYVSVRMQACLANIVETQMDMGGGLSGLRPLQSNDSNDEWLDRCRKDALDKIAVLEARRGRWEQSQACLAAMPDSGRSGGALHEIAVEQIRCGLFDMALATGVQVGSQHGLDAVRLEAVKELLRLGDVARASSIADSILYVEIRPQANAAVAGRLSERNDDAAAMALIEGATGWSRDVVIVAIAEGQAKRGDIDAARDTALLAELPMYRVQGLATAAVSAAGRGVDANSLLQQAAEIAASDDGIHWEECRADVAVAAIRTGVPLSSPLVQQAIAPSGGEKPLNADSTLKKIATTLAERGRYSEALQIAQKTEYDSQRVNIFSTIAAAKVREGDDAGALATAEESPVDERAGVLMEVALAMRDAGRNAEAAFRAAESALEQLSVRSFNSYLDGMIKSGRYKQALDEALGRSGEKPDFVRRILGEIAEMPKPGIDRESLQQLAAIAAWDLESAIAMCPALAAIYPEQSEAIRKRMQEVWERAKPATAGQKL